MTGLSFGDFKVRFGIQADGLTPVMLSTVTFVGTLIAIYAVGYMHGDEGYPRFFAVVSLFLFSMTGLVLANNFILLYAFWEGVGLCSYLLIGFWFSKPAAAAAARKAFLVTRLGDVGLFLGILSFGHFSRSPRPARWCHCGRSTSRTSSLTPTHNRLNCCVPLVCCCFAERSASRPSFRCTSGCPTPWKARRRSAP